MKIVCISDTHTQLNDISLPHGDLLIHSGDATYRGTIQELSKFNHHLNAIKGNYTHGIVFTPGNHDWLFQRNEQLAREIVNNATVLIDQQVDINGFKIYGSPWQPEFCNWAFNLPRTGELKEKWDLIPDNTNILVTHGPPMGILDVVPSGEHVGCVDLYNKIQTLPNLKLHNFGHIHYSYGTMKIGNTHFINSSICTEQYKTGNNSFTINLTKGNE